MVSLDFSLVDSPLKLSYTDFEVPVSLSFLLGNSLLNGIFAAILVISPTVRFVSAENGFFLVLN